MIKKFVPGAHSPRKERNASKLVAGTQNCSKTSIRDKKKLSTYSGDEKRRHEERLLELNQASVKGDGIVHEDGIKVERARPKNQCTAHIIAH